MDKDKTELAERMKKYEQQVTGKEFIERLPVYMRLDGRAFHTFCRGLDKPFDRDFIKVMQEVTKVLVEKTNAQLGYVQSDEISLGWSDTSKVPFRKVFKMLSVIPSLATSVFVMESMKVDKLKNKVIRIIPSFDCRVYQLPCHEELANNFLWREIDAMRNSISMMAQSMFSHKELQGKSSLQMKDMLKERYNVDYDLLDPILKRGSYFKRILVSEYISDDIWDKIPDNKKPKTREVIRSKVRLVKMGNKDKEEIMKSFSADNTSNLLEKEQ